jgi:hypothetical protein
MSNAVTLLDDTLSLLREGPTENPDFLSVITTNVEAIKKVITDSKADVSGAFTGYDDLSFFDDGGLQRVRLCNC